METAKPHPLPQAVKGFHAGHISNPHVKYPHLPKAIPIHMPGVHYPKVMSTGHKAPATKLPMGMTMPIMTKMGGHPADTASRLPPVGRSTN